MAAAEEAGQRRGGLQSELRVLRERHRGWWDTLAACLPLLRALANVGRQAEAARRVSFGETPLRAFARLPERLRLKQRAAMEALLAELRREKLPALREARDAVGARLVLLLALGEPGPAPDPQPRAPFPPWADLVAGLLDAEALYHAVYPSPPLRAGKGGRQRSGCLPAEPSLTDLAKVLGSAAAAALAELPGRGGGAGCPPGLGTDNAARAARRPRGRNVAESHLLPGGHLRALNCLIDSSGRAQPALLFECPWTWESAVG